MSGTLELGMGGALNTGASNEWWTPPEIFEALDISFDLDPCAPSSPAAPHLPAADRYSLPDDGLALPWFGRVWLNPPYGRETAKWMGRLLDHGDGIALVFARVDSKWAQQALKSAAAVCFIAGRISFIDGTGRTRSRKGRDAANPSMLLGFGPDCGDAVVGCGLGISFPAAQLPDLQKDKEESEVSLGY